MRLIDADALIENVTRPEAYSDYEYALYADGFIEDINNAPTIEPSGDLISREDAIERVELITKCEWDNNVIYRDEVIDALKFAPSAEPIVIRSKMLMPTNDFKEWAKRIRETNPNAVVIPCDAEVVSAEAVEEAEEPDEAHWMPLPGSYIEEDPT